MDSAQHKMMKQLTAIKNIPEYVLENWPAVISFSIVDYILLSSYQMIPEYAGTPGRVLNAGLRGLRDVVLQVTWDAIHVRHGGGA